ncbi:MAG: hypothetical protein LUC23_02450, partial [Prevotellaceae bacterium]|nr:hypothetical protein [Prevotellaceae bacterium]
DNAQRRGMYARETGKEGKWRGMEGTKVAERRKEGNGKEKRTGKIWATGRGRQGMRETTK